MPSYEKAVSFSGTTPPEDAKEIDRRRDSVLGTVIYYKAPKSGTIYYATSRGLKFAKKMEEAIRRQKTKK